MLFAFAPVPTYIFDDTTLGRLQALGATAFLTKPLDIRRVLEFIDEMLKHEGSNR